MPDDLAQINLQTDRMTIRSFTEADMTAQYLSWLNDSAVLRHSQQRLKEQDLASCRAYRDAIMAAGGAMLAMCVRDEPADLHIGNLTLRPLGPANNEIDISILIGERSKWGQGYATEAWRAICAHLFEAHGVRRITAGTHHDNKEMRALMARTGMQPFEPAGDAPRENIYMALAPDRPHDGHAPRQPD